MMMFWLCFLHAVMLTWSGINVSLAASPNNEQDRQALLAIKDQIREDPLGALSSWNDSLHYCQWKGVTCASRHRDRVQILNLKSQKLEGTLSPHIGNLSFLREIKLNMNNFHGPIPQEVGRLSWLELLSLANNLFSGEIPVVLTSLSKLTVLHLFHNQFQGTIPSSLGNLSSLTILDLGGNSLRGSILEDLCRIRSLTIFRVSTNNLIGIIPSCLYNLSNIEIFLVGGNQLDGTLPRDIGLTLPNLKNFGVAKNNFTGIIPLSMSNASSLERIELGINQLTGNVPSDIGSRLQNLEYFGLSQNFLGTDSGQDLDFISSLTNCSLLQQLQLGFNSLKGPIPNSIANLSTGMIRLVLESNLIHGHIPVGIENLINLEGLSIPNNYLTGEIPKSLVMLPKMIHLDLSNNKLSGKIPDYFGNSSLLEHLYLDINQLNGSIPMSLSGHKKMFALDLSENNLSGTIPKNLIGLSSIKRVLNLSNNALSGPLPIEVGELTNLQALDISSNRLSGAIPMTLGNCLTLEYLFIHSNFFTGSIPPSLGALRGLKQLNVSHNELVGEIPKYLQNFSALTKLDLSYNNLEGPVPIDGVFANVSVVSVFGNSKLCGGIVQLGLFPCRLNKKNGKLLLRVKVLLSVISVSVCLTLSCLLFICYRRRVLKAKPTSPPLLGQWLTRISYAELLKATNGFAIDHLVGVGHYGSVYKGVLDHANIVIAVKVFNLQEQGAAKSFLSECSALRNLRHRNLLRIITSCASVDFKGNDFKALVFKYMPNGSLEEWLHSKGVGQHEMKNLNFLQRLNIAIDVASALDYLHNHCQPTIVHCDLKPSNVLLDDDMTAHVADFGLAKIFPGNPYDSSQSQTCSLAIKGSFGYVAPEYGVGGQVSVEGDVYSYGVLLLEMFTGKRPTDEMFQDGRNLHGFARTALLDQVMNIVDPRMLLEDTDKAINNLTQSTQSARLQECLVSTITLGVECSAESPVERLNIGEMVRKLYIIKKHYQGIHLE